MSIDWKAVERKARQQAKKSGTLDVDMKKIATKNRNYEHKLAKENEVKKRKEKLKSISDSPSKTIRGGKKHTKRQGKSTLGNVGYDAYEQAQSDYAIPKFMRNASESYINNSITGTIHKLATGKPLLQEINNRNPYNKQLHTGLSANLGQLTGQGLAFMTQSAMASPATNKAATIFANTKLGQALGSKIGTGLVTGLAENAIDAGTVGLVQNLGMAYGDGLRGNELRNQVLKDTAFDLGFGSAMEVAGNVLPKIAKRKNRLNQLEMDSVDVTKNIKLDNHLPDPRKFEMSKNEQLKDARLVQLSEEIKHQETKMKAEKKRTQRSNVQKELFEQNKTVAEGKYNELLDEYIKVSNMSPDEYVEYAGLSKPSINKPKIKNEAVPKKGADLSPEYKKKIFDSVKSRSGLDIVEEELPLGLDGYFENGKIHVSKNAINPQFTVLKHELTHSLQSSGLYEDFSNFIIDGIKNAKYDIDELRLVKKQQYLEALGKELDDIETDQEIVAEFCGEFLFNSEKSIERLAREKPDIFVRIYEWIVDTIKKIGADEETKFLIDAQRKYEKALDSIDPKAKSEIQALYVRATKEEMEKAKAMEREGKTPEEIKEALNLHRGFKRHWLFETDDSKMLINPDVSSNPMPVKDAIKHPELFDRLELNKKNQKIDEYLVDKKNFLNDNLQGQVLGQNISLNAKLSAEEANGTLVHELQHAIQRKAHLPRGASPEAYKMHNNATELVKAKNEYNTKLIDAQNKFEDLIYEYEKATNSTISPMEILAKVKQDSIASYSNYAWDLIAEYEVFFNDDDKLVRMFHDYIDELEPARRLEKYLDDAAFDLYWRTAGEIEARDVKDRLHLTAEERRKTMPNVPKDFVYSEDYYSVGDKSSFNKSENLKTKSEKLYGEKGNKYLSKTNESATNINVEKKQNNKLPKAENGVDLSKANKLKAVKPKKLTHSISADVNKHAFEKPYKDIESEYPSHPKGTPSFVSGAGEISKAADTIKASPYFADNKLQQAIEDNITNLTKTYKSNKVTLENATKTVEGADIDTAYADWMKKMGSGHNASEEEIMQGALISEKLSASGRHEEAFNVVQELVETLSQTGRRLQSANMFLAMTPYGRGKSVQKLAKKMSERYGKDIKVEKDLLEKLYKATDEVSIDKIKREIEVAIWDQVPAGVIEKLDAFRYMAMLSSPKTHVRNLVGNTAMFIGKELSDTMEIGLQKYVFKGKMEKYGAMRNKSVLNHFSNEDRKLLKEGDRLFEAVKDTILNGSAKYIEKGTMRPLESRVFKNKLLEGSRKFVSGSLERADEIFMKVNFKAAFAKICKANGLTLDELQPKELRQFVEFAKLEAQKATFRDPNALASVLNKVSKYANTPSEDFVGKMGKGALKLGMDTLAPFVRTPANVLKQGVRYTGLGVAEGMVRILKAKDADALMKGIEAMSNGLVGAPVVIGGYLAAKGLLSSDVSVTGELGESTDKKTKYDKALGEQNYSIRIGENTYTLDWLSPYSMPFFVGVNIGEASKDGPVGITECFDAFFSLTEPFLEMSMLQGIQGVFDAMQYGDNKMQELAQNQIKSYITQFAPALFQQIAKTMSDTTRTPSRVNDETSSGKFLTGTKASLAYKIPVLHDKLEPKVDIWGRTENKSTAEDYAWAAVNNLVNPANVKKANVTPVDREILKMYDKLDDDKSSVIPELPKSKVEFDNEEYKMTDKEYTKFKKEIGKLKYDGLAKLFKTEKYKKATDVEKQKLIKNVYDEANEEAKKNYLVSSGKMSEETYSKRVLEKADSKHALDMIKQGKTTAKKVLDAKRELQKANASRKPVAQAYILSNKYDLDTIRAVNKNMSDIAISEGSMLKKTGVPLEVYETAKVKANLDGKGTIKNKEAEIYIKSLPNLDQPQRHALFDALASHPDAENPF